MKHTRFLTRRYSGKTIMAFAFAYLAMVTAILVLTANPLLDLDFGMTPQPVSASNQVLWIDITEVQLPEAPYLIVQPATQVPGSPNS